MPETPKHSFVILAYKNSPFLEACIQSLENQTVKSDIYISTSTPSNFLATISNKYDLPLLINTKREGIAADWNFAFNQGNSEFLTLAHQDDLYMQDYTETCLAFANQSGRSLILFTDYVELYNNRIKENTLLLISKRLILLFFYIFTNHLSDEMLKKALISIGNPVCCPTIMYNKKKIGNFKFNSAFSMNLDWEAALNLSMKQGDFIYIPKKLLARRIHSASESTNALLNKRRQFEDQQLLEIFWPKYLAKIIVKVYSLAYQSNG